MEVASVEVDSPARVEVEVEVAVGAAVEVEVGAEAAGVSGPPPPVPLTDAERGVAGASARAEGVRRSQKREARIRTKHPRIGGLLLAVSDDPSSTKVWAQGAVGEERIGAYLDAARPQGIEVLHDRRVPRSRANIDHLVIAPTGIWVVDPKRYLSGRLERRDVGGWRTTDLRLYVGSRDQTKLVTAMAKQIELVARSLVGTPFADVPVHGALCFVDTPLGLFSRPFVLQGVHVTWRKHLLKPMLEVAEGAPAIDGGTKDVIARHLADTFKPAWVDRSTVGPTRTRDVTGDR